MVSGIDMAARGMQTRMKNLDIVANNLANSNTTGFKRELPFSTMLDQFGNVTIKQNTDFNQGEVVQTSNPLDLAISGKGYFVVQTDRGKELTRDGGFKINNDGYLVNGNGDEVLGNNGPIYLNTLNSDKKNQITISNKGEISLGKDVVDTLLVAQMNDPENAQRTEGVNFSPGPAGYKILSDDNYTIKQGYLEESNVNPIKEMEEMIQLSHEYDSSHKMINYLDKSLDEANQIGKV